ncbi:tetratricopeptide repeat protein [Geomonas limicola]|uniref:tetratricopeptide repeat protein n=1 Tax=Geomonas limicola TaxID=2740186 RepID=UPI001FE75CB2|nr:tetratricopeptide repeat protein [Geomonas limicola]
MYDRAVAALDAGETSSALAFLERALKIFDNACWYSYLGYCVAKERGQVRKGVELCGSALQQEPENPIHFLNLARVHLVAGKKVEALQALREGMNCGGNAEILSLLEKIGTRKPPVFSFLPRNHALNRVVGLVLDRLKLR